MQLHNSQSSRLLLGSTPPGGGAGKISGSQVEQATSMNLRFIFHKRFLSQ